MEKKEKKQGEKKKNEKKESEKKGNEKPISLYPLNFDEAIQALIKTKAPTPRKTSKKLKG